MSKQKIRGFLKTKKEIFVEVGAGNRKGINGWLTIDISEK
jgi:hypothetical protein